MSWPLTLEHPLWLPAAAALAAGVVLLAWRHRGRGAGSAGDRRDRRRGAGHWRRRGRGAGGAWWRLDQRGWATALRALAVALLALALAGPRWAAAGTGVDVVFLVDASDSVGASGRAEALAWVREALAARGDDDRAAMALAGRDARLEYALRHDPSAAEPAAVVDGTATDLARGLRLAHGVLGGERRRRVVLLTDGRPTQGDLLSAAADLADAGIRLDLVPLRTAGAADLLVEDVRAPGRVREGESYEVRTLVRNTGDRPADAVLTVLADGAEVDRRRVTVPPGTLEVTTTAVAERPGRTVRYEARLASAASAVAANEVGRAAVRVQGPPQVLVFAGAPGAGNDLAAALESAGVPVEVVDADEASLPPLDRLLDFESTVLVDVPATTLGESGMQALDAYVRDAGRGVVAVGGESSYGMGDYEGTPLEELLPVFARITDPRRRQSVAQALVVDTSGSMAACHCRDEGFGGPVFQEGGPVKTDIAKEAVARAIEGLETQDTVGVLAFDTRSSWVIPLQQLPSPDTVDDGLARLTPQGDTDIPQAVREAIAGLQDVEARLRHIVLFTDGFMHTLDGLFDAAREARDAGITVSVVGTGEGSFEELRRVAALGGGRYYPGRDLSQIPNIIALEVLMSARPVVQEGSFLPIVTGTAAPTEALVEAPPLRGYLATTAKPTARTLLAIGDERDPLLATWQAGLGTAVAWTSDATAHWSADWLAWSEFARFWSDVVKSTFPAEGDEVVRVSASAGADGLRVLVESASALPAGVTGTAVVTDPTGERTEVALERTGAGMFVATVPGGAEGVYAVTVALRDGETVLHREATTAIRSYSPEYAALPADEVLLRAAVAPAGGAVGPAPEAAFDPAGLPPGASSRELWPLLVLLACAAAVADVGLRRLRLERGDWRRVAAWVSGRLPGGRPPTAPVERDEATAALFAAKRRAHRGDPDP